MMHIEHIAVWTHDLERLKAFYETYFAGKANDKYVNASKQFESYFVTFASGARLEIMHAPGVAQTSENTRTGYAHLAFSVGTEAAVDALTARLREDGYQVVSGPRHTGDGYYESGVLDPDGNPVEIVSGGPAHPRQGKPFPVIETRRLKLREPLDTDARELMRVTQDKAVMRYYGMESMKSEEEALREIGWFNRIFAASEGIRWVITEQGNDRYVGDAGFHKYVPAHSRAELGYKLASAYWRQGLMTETLSQVMRYGFLEMGLNRIEALVDPRNTASLELLKKLGFKAEGVFREYEHEKGKFIDLAMLSLLRSEWDHTITLESATAR
jgi:ribosomal-protein-alanine N-acetyltransferase